jgi:hypothetical protein
MPFFRSGRNLLYLLCALSAGVVLPAVGAKAQVIEAPFSASYTFTDLGSVPSLPPLYGGLNFRAGDLNTLIIGGNANEDTGELYSIGVTRGLGGHITGFTGTATFFADGAFNDGGLTYGPGGVLFYTRWPVNEVGQHKPGSLPGAVTTDKIVDLDPLGVSSSTGALNFVPAGFGGAGQMKLVSWDTGDFYTIDFAPDGGGTFDLTAATLETTLPGGPEGFVYIAAGNPQFAVNSLLVSEFTDGMVAVYDLDGDGNPIVATRRTFMSDLEGAEGALIDPVTGDFLFSTFGGGDRIIVVQGFAPPAAVPEPGSIALLVGGGFAGLFFVRRRRR